MILLVERVEKCKTYGELAICLESNVNQISEHLGYECDECEDKEYEINRLERDNYDLDETLFNSFVPKTLDDEYKLEAFMKAKDNFTVSEFESLVS